MGSDPAYAPGLTAKAIYSNLGGRRSPGLREHYTEVWQVSGFDRSSMQLSDVYGCKDLPLRGEKVVTTAQYNKRDMPDLYVTDLELESYDPQDLIRVRVSYMEDPLELPLIVNAGGFSKEESVWADKNGKIPTNTMCDPFNPPFRRVRGCARFEVTRRYTIEAWLTNPISNYIKRKNSADFQLKWLDAEGNYHTGPVWPAATVFLDDIRSSMMLDPYTHYCCTFSFLIDIRDYLAEGWNIVGTTASNTPPSTAVGWIKVVPNAGSRFWDTSKSPAAATPFWADPTKVQNAGIGLLKADGSAFTANLSMPAATFLVEDDILEANFMDFQLNDPEPSA